jgi:protein-disulfide isomerase
MSEGSSKFGVNGTPGNVLINTKTGKYEVVSGAQPEANFAAAIERLLK